MQFGLPHPVVQSLAGDDGHDGGESEKDVFEEIEKLPKKETLKNAAQPGTRLQNKPRSGSMSETQTVQPLALARKA
ncbi:MAG: hypothetical protein R6V19_15630 [Armatimonadota bacterium]